MLHQASIPLGIDLWFMAGSPDDSAAQVSPHVRVGSARSQSDLAALAQDCPIVTFEHEVVALDALATLAGVTTFRPGHRALSAVADKLAMRTALAEAGLPVPEWTPAGTVDQVMAALTRWPNAVVKLSRGGYDGRGVFMVDDAESARSLAVDLVASGIPLLIEPRLAFDAEVAVIVVRPPDGETIAYDPVTTVQVDGQCRSVFAPALVECNVAARAQRLAADVARAIDAVGLVAVEFFLVEGELVINELAVRPHNTGHHTIDAAITSQFENHIRAVAGMPVGDPSLRSPAVMVNVIGNSNGDDPRTRLNDALSLDPAAYVHLYGKASRPNRKIGHVTVCDDDIDRATTRAWRMVAALAGDVPVDMQEMLT